MKMYDEEPLTGRFFGEQKCSLFSNFIYNSVPVVTVLHLWEPGGKPTSYIYWKWHLQLFSQIIQEEEICKTDLNVVNVLNEAK